MDVNFAWCLHKKQKRRASLLLLFPCCSVARFFFQLFLDISPNRCFFPPSRHGWTKKTRTNRLTVLFFIRSEKDRRNSILSTKWLHCHLPLSRLGEVITGKFCRRGFLSHSQDGTHMQGQFSSHSNPGVVCLLTKKSSFGLFYHNVSSGALGTNSLAQCLYRR